MNVGLCFKLENSWGNFLYQILEKIDIKKYSWVIEEYEIITLYEGKYLQLFSGNRITGEKFLNKIKEDKYYLICANIKAYSNYPHLNEKIDRYEDFNQSDCQLMLLCNDSIFIEIYCKNESELNSIYDSCQLHGFTELNYINENKITRTYFHNF